MTRALTQREQLLARLLSQYNIRNAEDIVRAHGNVAAHAPDLSDCLAMIENETHGNNEFGGEGSACPRAWYEGPVTRYRYTVYKVRRALGFSNNGVGPTQLTSTGYQIQAQKLGGCWKPLHNCEVGFTILGTLVREYGRQAGFTAYNGSGPEAIAYGERAIEYAQIWHDRFIRAGLA